MEPDRERRLFELADVILAVSRHIEAAKRPASGGGSPLHGAVLRHIDSHPGATVGEVAEATRMISSNVSRAIRGLEDAGYIRRAVDADDARRVRLFPTGKAEENLMRLRQVWSRLLDNAVDDAQAEAIAAQLRHIETGLINAAD